MQVASQSYRSILSFLRQNGRFFAIISVCILMLILAPSTSTQDAPIPYQEYLALIGQMRGEVLNIQGQPSTNCSNRLTDLTTQLNNITQIIMPDGSIMSVKHAQAGLPLSFSACHSADFIGFLNGICPAEVCLTSGVVVPPEETAVDSTGVEVTQVDLADFANSEQLPQNIPSTVPAPSDDPASSDMANSDATDVNAVVDDTAGNETVGDVTSSDEDVGDVTTGEEENGEATSEESVEGEGIGDEEENGVPTDEQGEGDESTEENGEVGLEETAVIEPITQNRQGLWVWVIIGLVILITLGGAIVYWQYRKKEPNLHPETIKKVEENVESGRRLLSEGEYREAIHKLFNATLRILEDRQLLRFERAHTNYELLRAETTVPPLVAHLTPVVDTYDRVWYGYEPLATAEFEALVDQIEQLKTVRRS